MKKTLLLFLLLLGINKNTGASELLHTTGTCCAVGLTLGLGYSGYCIRKYVSAVDHLHNLRNQNVHLNQNISTDLHNQTSWSPEIFTQIVEITKRNILDNNKRIEELTDSIYTFTSTPLGKVIEIIGDALIVFRDMPDEW